MKIILTEQEQNCLHGFIELLVTCPCEDCVFDYVDCQSTTCQKRLDFDNSLSEDFYIRGKKLYEMPELSTIVKVYENMCRLKHQFQKALDEYHELIVENPMYEVVDENKLNNKEE